MGMMASLVAGCGDAGPKLTTVSGKVLVDGVPLAKGGVRFVPCKDKGNTTTTEPIGVLSADGSYSLSTFGQPGAPLGWYMVAVTGQGSESATMDLRAIKNPVAPKYGDPATSGFLVEVVPSPAAGAYDFKVSAK